MMKKLLSAILALLMLAAVTPLAGVSLAEAEDPAVMVVFVRASQTRERYLAQAQIINDLLAELPHSSFCFACDGGRVMTQLTRDGRNAVFVTADSDPDTLPQLGESVENIAAGTALWVILPACAADGAYNAEAAQTGAAGAETPAPDPVARLADILEKEDTSLHFLVIGNAEEKPVIGGDSQIGWLSANYPGQVSVLRMLEDGLATETKDPELHTADWAIASIIGDGVPVSLPAAEDGKSFRVTLPKDGALFVASYGEKNCSHKLTDPNGGESKPDVSKKCAINNSGLMYTLYQGLSAGDYTVAKADSMALSGVRAFWFPALGDLRVRLAVEDSYTDLLTRKTPVTEEQEAVNVRRERQTILVSVENSVLADLGNAEARVSASCGSVAEELSLIGSSESENGWVFAFEPRKDMTSVDFTASVTLDSADGNRIKAWNGTFTLPVIDSPITVKGFQTEQDFYFLSQPARSETRAFSVDDLFAYNPNDPVSFYLNDKSLVPSMSVGGVAVSYGGDGRQVGLSCLQGAQHDRKVNLSFAASTNGTVRMVSSIRLHLHDLRAEVLERATVTVTRNGEVIGPEDGQRYPLSVGTDYTVTFTLGAKEAALWNEVCRRVGLPALDDMQASFSCAEEPVQFAQQADGSYAASVPVSQFISKEMFDVSCALGQDGQEYLQRKISMRFENSAPYIKRGVEREKNVAVALDDIPLLGQADGSARLAAEWDLSNCFKDDETEASGLTYYIAISPEYAECFEIMSDGSPLAPNGEGEFVVGPGTDTNVQVMVTQRIGESWFWATDDPEAEIRVWAKDAEKGSDPFVYRVSARSNLRLYLSYAAAALAVLIVLAILFIVISNLAKPSFANISVSCAVVSDEDRGMRELMMQSSGVHSLADFGKKPIQLNQLLVLTRQPPLPDREQDAAGEILLYPARGNAIRIKYGKAAERLGKNRTEKLEAGRVLELRFGHSYVIMQNVR